MTSLTAVGPRSKRQGSHISRTIFYRCVVRLTLSSALSAVAALALVMPASAQASANVLANPGFESPLGGTQISGTAGSSFGNWTAYSFRPAIPLPAKVSAPNPVHSGNSSGEVTDPPGIGSAFFYQDLSSFDPNSTYTVSAWVYPVTGSQALEFVFGWDRGAAGRVTGSSTFSITPTEISFGAWEQSATQAPPVSYNTWHHIQLVVDGTTLTSRLYVDGSCQGASPAGQAVPSGSASTMFIGYGSAPPVENHFYWDDLELTPGIQVTGSCPIGGHSDSPLRNNSESPNQIIVNGGIVTQSIASFTDPDLAATQLSYTATVDWGDGYPVYSTNVSPLGISPFGYGQEWWVNGAHRFTTDGQYHGVVTVVDTGSTDEPGGASVSIPTTFIVTGLPPAVSQNNKNAADILAKSFFLDLGGFACGAGAATAPTGAGAAVAVMGCSATAADLVSLEAEIADPPDPRYTTAYVPQPFPVPRLSKSCKRLGGSRCRQLRTAEGRYIRALAALSSASEAVGITANRFGGAVAAHDLGAAQLQRNAESKYLSVLDIAVTQTRAAGRRLGRTLRRDHLDRVVSASQVAKARIRLGRLQGLPAWTVSRLERDLLIANPDDLKRLITEFLRTAAPPRRTTVANSLAR